MSEHKKNKKNQKKVMLLIAIILVVFGVYIFLTTKEDDRQSLNHAAEKLIESHTQNSKSSYETIPKDPTKLKQELLTAKDWQKGAIYYELSKKLYQSGEKQEATKYAKLGLEELPTGKYSSIAVEGTREFYNSIIDGTYDAQ